MSLESRFAHFSVRRPRVVLAAVALFIAVCAAVIFLRGKVDSDVLNLLPQRFASVRALKVYNREFSQAREITFALWDETHEADLDAFAEYFGDALRKEPWVVRVLDRSPMDEPGGAREMQRLAVPLLLDQEPAGFGKTLQALAPDAITKRFALKRAEMEAGSPKAEMELTFDPLGIVTPILTQFSSSFSAENTRPMASPDGTLRVVVALSAETALDEKACTETLRKVEDFKARVLAGWTGGAAPRVLVTGRIAYVGELAGGMKQDMLATLAGSLVLVSGVFLAGFRRIRPLLAILGVLILCCLGAVAAGIVCFQRLNLITIGLCSILVGLGVDFGMLLYGSYQANRHCGLDHPAATADSAHRLGRGILFGASTTAAAFLSLLLSESLGFAQLGVLIGIGILLAAALMLTVFYVFIGSGYQPGGRDPLLAATQSWLDHTLATPKPAAFGALAVLLAATVFAIAPVGKVRFEANPQSLEPPNSHAGFALRKIKEKLISGKAEPVLAIVQGSGTADFHAQWTAAQTHWQAAKDAGEIAGFSTPAAFAFSPERTAANLATLASLDTAASRQALQTALDANGFDPEPFQNAFDVLNAMETLRRGDRAPLDWRSVLPEASSWRFILDRFLSSTPNIGAAYITPNRTIATPSEQAALRRVLDTPGIRPWYTGWSYVMADLVPWSQGKLVELSAAMVLFNIVLLVFMYRAVAPLAVLMLSLGLSIGAMIAGLKLTGLPLNLFNVLSFPLVLGVGVDYGIYVVLAVRQSDGARRVPASIVKPVLLSGLTTIAGFGSLGWANHPALSSLGLVCALGVACCLFSTLFFILPAYLWKGYR
ncbi:MAG: MMPL family transporter [Chthoniobacteraceae bacterium]|nr:MMPL family transporter [Chthoniobacteraceae bacterium]